MNELTKRNKVWVTKTQIRGGISPIDRQNLSSSPPDELPAVSIGFVLKMAGTSQVQEEGKDEKEGKDNRKEEKIRERKKKKDREKERKTERKEETKRERKKERKREGKKERK